MQKFITSEIKIKAEPEFVLENFLELNHLSKWWGVDSAFIEKKDGGLYCLTWLKSPDGIKFISTGIIKLYSRKSHLHLEKMLYINSEKPILGPFTIEYNVEKQGQFTLLSIRQGGFQKGNNDVWEWYYQAVLDGWPEALVMLKQYIERLP